MSLVGSSRSGRLAEVLGHELRNPLASAVANVGVALEMTDAGDPRESFLARALEDLTRASALLTGYLDYGRSGRPTMERIDLVAVAKSIQSRRSGRAVLTVERGAAAIPLRGDAILLERLIENLVENSESMGAKRIELRLECRGDHCLVHVADDGPGVPAELADSVFEPAVSGRGSTGLGLALCRDVAEAHGGSLDLVPSKAGAMFCLRLPLELAEAAACR